MKRFSELKQEAKTALKGRFWSYFWAFISIPILVGILSSIPLLGIIVGFASIPLSMGGIYLTLQFLKGDNAEIRNWFVGYKRFWRVVWTEIVKGFLIGIWVIIPVIVIGIAASFVLPQAPAVYSMGENARSQIASLSMAMRNGDIDTDDVSSIPLDLQSRESDFLTSRIAGAGVVGLLLFLLYIAGVAISVVVALSFAMVDYILVEKPELKTGEILRLSKRMMLGQKWRFFLFGLSFIGWLLLVGITFGIAAIWVTPYMQVSLVAFYDDINTNFREI